MNFGLSCIAGYLLNRSSKSFLSSFALGLFSRYVFASLTIRAFNSFFGYSFDSSKCLCISEYLSDDDCWMDYLSDLVLVIISDSVIDSVLVLFTLSLRMGNWSISYSKSCLSIFGESDL